MTHAPGARLVNWFTAWFRITAYRPLCGRLAADDIVADPNERVSCPACQRTLQQAKEVKL